MANSNITIMVWIICSCETVQQVAKVKYLGILIDKEITWKSHVNKLHAEIRKSIRSFYFLRNICEVGWITLYVALIHS